MEPDAVEVPVRRLILWPAVITLGVTLLRLAGELQRWNPALFGRSAGGGGSLVGITWLVPVFGIWFALRLLHLGHAPSSAGRAIGIALAAFAMVPIWMGVAQGALHMPVVVVLPVAMALSIPVVLVALRGWPALGRVLFGYGLAARVPVILVMLVAMIGNWGTHYDVAPPELPPVGLLAKFLLIGVLPQLTIWMAFTVAVGMLFGGLAAAVAGARRPAPASAQA